MLLNKQTTTKKPSQFFMHMKCILILRTVYCLVLKDNLHKLRKKKEMKVANHYFAFEKFDPKNKLLKISSYNKDFLYI